MSRRRDIVLTNPPDVLNEDVADAAGWLLIDVVRELSRAPKPVSAPATG